MGNYELESHILSNWIYNKLEIYFKMEITCISGWGRRGVPSIMRGGNSEIMSRSNKSHNPEVFVEYKTGRCLVCVLTLRVRGINWGRCSLWPKVEDAPARFQQCRSMRHHATVRRNRSVRSHHRPWNVRAGQLCQAVSSRAKRGYSAFVPRPACR